MPSTVGRGGERRNTGLVVGGTSGVGRRSAQQTSAAAKGRRRSPRAHAARGFSADRASARVMGRLVFAAVVAAGGETGSCRDDLITVVTAALIYWVAAAYSSALGTQLVNRGSGWRAFGRQLRDQWPMVEAAGVPV